MVDVIGDSILYKSPSEAAIKNRREFYALRKKRGETTKKWLERVCTHASCCEFLTLTEYILIDKFVCGLNNEEIESILNTDTWTLNLLNERFVNRQAGIVVNAAPIDIVKCEPVSTMKQIRNVKENN